MSIPIAFPSVAADHIGLTFIEVKPERRAGRGRWWRRDGQGYTDNIDDAGHFVNAERASGSETAYHVSLQVVVAWLKGESLELKHRAERLEREARIHLPIKR